MVLMIIISAMLTTFPKEETPKVIRFSNDMVLVEETTLPKPFVTNKR